MNTSNYGHEILNQSEAWASTDGLHKVEREVGQVEHLTVQGSIDVVIVAGADPRIIVASDSPGGDSVQIRQSGSRLEIKHEGLNVVSAGGSIRVSGSGNIVAGRSISIRSGGEVVVLAGGQGNITYQGKRTVVAVMLPLAPNAVLAGSGSIELLSVDQENLELSITGSGSISAKGRVNRLTASLMGSGDFRLGKLEAQSADLAVSGSGDIKSTIRESASAKVTGSGDIVIKGNPAKREKLVTGSGSVRFKD
ncbi:GIN domain-containing protein [Pseudomonas aeruginosa]|uniref:GIN domain-containing protein n=1 Tax=Pseudomonas aeruginosa TaxID=287 RepID=UPI00070DA3C2|nr:DUF2807 domain-containing protein [Pseudomonas aeruginosa]